MAQPIDRDPSSPPNDAEEPTGDLIREVINETRQLVQLEVALAREEVRMEMARARFGGMVLGTAAGAGISGLTLCLVAAVLTFSAPAVAALVVGASLVSIAILGGWVGWKKLPKRPMNETRSRLEADFKQLKEHIV
jgi:hypothetical protein